MLHRSWYVGQGGATGAKFVGGMNRREPMWHAACWLLLGEQRSPPCGLSVLRVAGTGELRACLVSFVAVSNERVVKRLCCSCWVRDLNPLGSRLGSDGGLCEFQGEIAYSWPLVSFCTLTAGIPVYAPLGARALPADILGMILTNTTRRYSAATLQCKTWPELSCGGELRREHLRADDVADKDPSTGTHARAGARHPDHTAKRTAKPCTAAQAYCTAHTADMPRGTCDQRPV